MLSLLRIPAKGRAERYIVICPVHKAQYDVPTGKVVKNVSAMMSLANSRRASDLRIYEVQVVEDSILIKV